MATITVKIGAVAEVRAGKTVMTTTTTRVIDADHTITTTDDADGRADLRMEGMTLTTIAISMATATAMMAGHVGQLLDRASLKS